MKFSLVLCTINRKKELEKFLSSLSQQSYRNFEIFIMDQNRNNLIDDIVALYKNNFDIKHLKLELAGLSRARNIGLKSINGQVVCFPDDDCWFDDKHFLEKIFKKFEENEEIDGLSVPVTDENGTRIIIPWPEKSCDIIKQNVFKAITSISFFIKKSALRNDLYFDEDMGAGSNKIMAGEETDFILYFISNGYKMKYFPDITIQHPFPYEGSNNLNYEKIYRYSYSLGFMLKKHSFPILFKLNLLLRPLLACFIYIYNPSIQRKYFQIFMGRYRGLVSKI